jgi:parallel beta-helix repeat protein
MKVSRLGATALRSSIVTSALFSIVLGATNASATFCQDRCDGNGVGGSFAYCIDSSTCGAGGTCLNFGCCDQTEVNHASGVCKCGDTLDGDVTLNHDLNCPSGDGLYVDSAGEDLNLDGHVISCDGTGGACGTGVTIDGGGATVKGAASGNKGGRIEGFNIGVGRTSSLSNDGTAEQLTITDGGLSMTYGIYKVKNVRKNVISGAAVWGGSGIALSQAANCFIEDNLVTDSWNGIGIESGGGGSNCQFTHNRAIGNEYGFAVFFAAFDTVDTVDNIFLNNTSADYADTTATNRLNTASNVCKLSGAGNACTLAGMDFVP